MPLMQQSFLIDEPGGSSWRKYNAGSLNSLVSHCQTGLDQFTQQHTGGSLRASRLGGFAGGFPGGFLTIPSQRVRHASFFEDGFQASSNQRVRNDEKLEKSYGDTADDAEQSNIPDPVPDERDTSHQTGEEKLLQKIHEDEEKVVQMVIAQKAAAKHEAQAEAHRAAQAAQARHQSQDVSRSTRQVHLPMDELRCRKRTNPLSCQDLQAQCAWSGDEITGSCHHSDPEEWPRGWDFLFGMGEVVLLETAVVTTAIVTRLRGRDLLRQFVERPSYSLRASMWFYPTAAMYFLTGWYYYTRTQGWDSFSTIYFLIQVVSTVGASDMSPVHPMPKLFTIFHVLLGLVLIGGAVGDELDRILETRIARMSDAVARGADFQDLVPILWRVAAETREAAGSRDTFEKLLTKLEEELPLTSPELPLMAERLRWLRDFQGGEVILAELTGTGALIPWPRAGQLWVGAGRRYKALRPLLQYVLDNPTSGMPIYDTDSVIDLLEDDSVLDRYYSELILRSALDIGAVIVSGTLFFGVADNWLRGRDAFSMFDGLYFSVAGASSVGMLGNVAAITSVEKVASMGLFCYGCYSFNRFMMFASEVFAYKIENSQNIVAVLPPGFGHKLQRLRKGNSARDVSRIASVSTAEQEEFPPSSPAAQRTSRSSRPSRQNVTTLPAPTAEVEEEGQEEGSL
ncbi:unnamed protein product [Durusdinium trenchii]|uniref:Potassium channel domain-containing protein n=2 Tax=Durusdinium trenchii TaxID=1381693 RepID=A0ABP0LW90_9DINO